MSNKIEYIGRDDLQLLFDKIYNHQQEAEGQTNIVVICHNHNESKYAFAEFINAHKQQGTLSISMGSLTTRHKFTNSRVIFLNNLKNRREMIYGIIINKCFIYDCKIDDESLSIMKSVIR